MPQEIINGILVTFTGDRHEKAAEIVAMFDRLAIRPVPDNEGRGPSLAPAMLEFPIVNRGGSNARKRRMARY